MKFLIPKRQPPLIEGDDIVYSPNKYRETEGIQGDYAKTLWKAQPPDHVSKLIKSYTKAKVPDFFQYAKDKLLHQVEKPNQSTMNRIAAKIPEPRIKFSKSISKFDYRMLMNLDYSFSITPDSSVIKSYDYWNARQTIFNEQNDNVKDQDLFCFQKIRKKILEENSEYELDYIVNTLVAVLYTTRNTSSKKTLWASFGDVIVENIKKNLGNSTKICEVCGKRFTPVTYHQICCTKECGKKLNVIKQLERNHGKN